MEIRACFDIGSGSTKLQVSQIYQNKIISTLFGQERPVAFGADLMKSVDGNLSEEIQQKGFETFTELKSIAQNLGATKYFAIATEVFRRASNGIQYIERIRSMGISIQIVSQEIEAELGFNSVIVNYQSSHPESTINFRNICVWDSGGASFQITRKGLSNSTNQNQFESYMGRFGTSIVLAALLKDIQGKEMSQLDLKSPGLVNPVSLSQGTALLSLLSSRLPNPIPSWLIESEPVESSTSSTSSTSSSSSSSSPLDSSSSTSSSSTSPSSHSLVSPSPPSLLLLSAGGNNSLFRICSLIMSIEREKEREKEREIEDSTSSSSSSSSPSPSNNNLNLITQFSLSSVLKVYYEYVLEKTDEELIQYQQYSYHEGVSTLVPKIALLASVLMKIEEERKRSRSRIQKGFLENENEEEIDVDDRRFQEKREEKEDSVFVSVIPCVGSCAGVLCDERFW